MAHHPPIIVTAIAAAKIAANSRSFTANARAQPKEASIESANNSCRPGSVHGAFIGGVVVPFVRTSTPPDPPRRGGPSPNGSVGLRTASPFPQGVMTTSA